ncbi:MAG: hypothetical protein GX601_12655 [Anaerolineales bacterium]|nr:hypothetical protein [Anaerolineales bacterium]
MEISQHDRDVLRRLLAEQAEIAALPVHKEKAELWRRLNQLEPVRPLVWINEIPWNEMDVNGELTLQCTDPWAQQVEQGLRQTLYQWRHMPGDMIVNDYLSCPLVIQSTGLGISEDVDIVRTDPTSGVVSRRFHRQISDFPDIEKIKMPEVTHDTAATEQHYQALCDIAGDLMPVRKVGKKGTWFAPWDELIRWWGVEEAMADLVLRPELVSAAMTRLVDAYLHELDQWVALNLLTRNDDNTRIGSGAYGYTDELPGEDFDPAHPMPHNLWGNATAQIFSIVSPEMHWEFALKHEMRWLERWGLTYYGCCEPLDIKLGILRRIPNLRKISMSPWIDTERAVAEVATDYVFSRKPTPAVFAEDRWRPELARQQLREFLDVARGCRIELVMKDISTVRYQPQRLWEWERIAMEMAEAYAP